MTNVLMLAYEFPPLNSGGSHRPYKFAKYLHEFGIHPIVLTTDTESHTGKNIDDSLFDEDQAMTVVRTTVDAPKSYDKYLESYYFNVVGTEAARWRNHCLAAIDRIVKKHKIAALYVTVPPFSMAGLGREIARKYNLPLVLDMRDAWSHWVVTPYASYLHYRLTLKRERTALNAADAIVVTSDQTMLDLQALHPDVPGEKFRVITNAFDETAPSVPASLDIPVASTEKPFVIGYVGSFYYTPYQRGLMFKRWWRKKPHQYLQYVPRKEDWLYRSPYFFFSALAKLREQRPDLAAILRVEFLGSIPDWLPQMIDSFRLSEIVVLRGRVGHKEALEFQASVDALLITSAKVVDGHDYSIAGKTFEYICMNKPVLAFVCEGAQKRLLEKTGLSICCPPDDIEASAEKLNDLLAGHIRLHPDVNQIEQLGIQRTTEQLAAVVKGVSDAKT